MCAVRCCVEKESEHAGENIQIISRVGHRPVFQPFSIAPVQWNDDDAEVIPPDSDSDSDRRGHVRQAGAGQSRAEQEKPGRIGMDGWMDGLIYRWTNERAPRCVWGVGKGVSHHAILCAGVRQGRGRNREN